MTGPSESAGKKVRAPIMIIMAISMKTNIILVVLKVPELSGIIY
jgi:hypothetical protein